MKDFLKAPRRPLAGVCLLALGFVLLSACSTTQKAQVTQTSGFLGADAAKLSPGGEGQMGLRYVNPAVDWTQYNKVMIAPVTLWGDEGGRISAADQQTVADFFSQQLHAEFGKKFPIVEKPGPGVMKITVALTDAQSSTPGLRTISTVVPQARVLSSLKFLATGSFPFVGAAQAEARITDSVSGKTLAAGADRQIGGGAVSTGFQWMWGDVENAITNWSKRMAERLSAWTSGQKP